jgi:hypothetical protein
MTPQMKAIMPGMPCKLKIPHVSINPKDFNYPSIISIRVGGFMKKTSPCFERIDAPCHSQELPTDAMSDDYFKIHTTHFAYENAPIQ